MGAVNSTLFHANKCNKCGISYDYYSTQEHRSRMSCKTKNGKFKHHCFAYMQYIPWWT